MKKNNWNWILACTVSLSLVITGCNSTTSEEYDWVKNAIDVASYQLKQQAAEVDNISADSIVFPRSIKEGKLRVVDKYDWTSGFFPGTLWYGYELTGDENLKNKAREYTQKLSEVQHYTGTHDLGFMMYCSYGNALRLAPLSGDSLVIINSSKSLASRYNPTVGLIRSWDFGDWSYPVIIDNMMNLEMLFWASKHSVDSSFYKVATRHADITMTNHFRPDMSSFHVVSYHPEDGSVESQGTFQGYSDESAWARGQAWGLYGYTVCYRETKDIKYLNQAKSIATYIMSNPAIAEDLVPYWDYNAPDIPNAPRDASAAAVTASALLELSNYVKDGTEYIDYAERILKSLSSDQYLSPKGQNHGFILIHSVGHLPANSEIDTPLNYADYYYLEALKRYIDIKQIDTKTL